MKQKPCMQLLALLLALTLLLSGCSLDVAQLQAYFALFTSEEGQEETDGSAEEEVTEAEDAEDSDTEDTLTVSDTIQAQQASIITLSIETSAGLNPFTCTSLANNTFFSLIYEGLFTVTPEFTAEPVLCRDYTVSDDELTYAFAIAQGVTFSDGNAMTAADVVYSLELARSSSMYSARFAYIDTIEATSTYQVVITLTTPMENLPILLDIPIVRSGTGYGSSPTGTGPYQYTTADGGSVLVQNANWWQDVEQPFRRIELLSITDNLDQRDQFEQGELDLVLTDPNAVGAATYHSDYELWSQSTTIMQYIGFNMDSTIFSQQTIRAAITYLIDRQTIVSDYAGSMALVAQLPVSPTSSLYNTKLAAQYAYDPDAFQAALDATDLTDSDGDGILELYGEKMEGTLLVCSDSSQRVAVAQMIADLLNDYGFSITVNACSASEYEEAMYYRNFDFYYAEVRLTADFDLSSFFASDGSMNYGGMTNSEALTLCLQSLENSGNYYNLYSKIMEEGLLCPVLFKLRAVYTTRGAVSGLSPSPSSIFYNLGNISCYGN